MAKKAKKSQEPNILLRHTATVVLFGTRTLLFVTTIILSYLIYRSLLRDIVHGEDVLIAFITLWLLSAYVILPRIHRYLTKIYLPEYFIGRVRSPDGLLGDPINLVVVNSSRQKLVKVMKTAGWELAEPTTITSLFKIVRAVLMRQSYPTAPVSSLFLFGRRQDLAFQQELNGNPARRHHVRFWQCPQGWLLPGGFKADWLAAATFDKNVGLSLFTFQIMHRISEDTDEERDYIVETIKKAYPEAKVDVHKNFSTGYHSVGRGGDAIRTDGDLPIVNMKSIN